MTQSRRFTVVLKTAVTLGILALGVAAAWYFLRQPPQVQRGQRQAKQAVVVQTAALAPTTVQARITAMGTVVPAQQTIMRAQVSGTVRHTHPQWGPGGRVRQGQTLVRIDPREYRFAVRRKQSALRQAEAELALEQGQQEIARQEWQMAQNTDNATIVDSALALREPQLQKARAQIESARADLEQAQLDLKRTTVTAPFDGLIRERSVDQGSFVGVQGQLATLVGTKAYWVQARVPVGQLETMRIPPGEAQGTPVTVHSQTGSGSWQGRVLRCTGSLSGQARMAEVLIEVPDPLGRTQDKQPALLLGDYVEVAIRGRQFEQVATLPRFAVRQKDTVWLYTEGQLDIRAVDVLWKNATDIVAPFTFADATRLVTSDLATPVQGMRLRRAEAVSGPQVGNATRSPAADNATQAQRGSGGSS